MFYWVLTFLCSFFALKKVGKLFYRGIALFDRSGITLIRVVQVLHEFEDILLSGLVPSQEKWDQIARLPHPWGSLTLMSLKALREAGGSLVPTLKRLRSLAEFHRVAWVNARAKAAPAIAQGCVCALFVPLMGAGLYVLLPGVHDRPVFWGAACLAALFISGMGGLWLIYMAEIARWGGISEERRSWILNTQCGGERFLALVRTGMPPDMAWVKTCELLAYDSRELARVWGYSVWDSPNFSSKRVIEQVLVDVAGSIKKAIQVSLMEGRPCTERVETVLLALRQDIEAQVERELSVLTTKALRPLFLCVAPSLFGLLICALWITVKDMGGEELLNVF